MMHSVALTDSHQVECVEEFILVQPPEYTTSFDLMEEDDDDGDDDSYDYCEDIYSIVSAEEQSMSVCSEMVDGRCSNKQEDVILSVPSVLLKDLDEAHAAATLAQIPDAEHRSDASTYSGARCSTNDATIMELDTRDETSGVAATAGPVKIETDRPPQQEEKHPPSQSTTSLSRSSNKKRRKKLKLMKKAVAATSAAQSLSDCGVVRPTTAKPSSPNSSMGQIFKHATKKTKTAGGSRRSSKRVANIAVACATETLSSYREELAKANKRYVA